VGEVSEQRAARRVLDTLLDEQRFGVLATAKDGRPYTNLVAFAVDPAGEGLYFATSRSTRKYMNLTHNPAASILVDNRRNRADDLEAAVAATAVGRVAEAGPERRDDFLRVYLDKHPMLESFVRSEDCAHLLLRVDRWFVVERFERVVEISLEGDRPEVD
jgi:uncharacterized pyridoxamine 5'-phosphate oxidase family protein